MLVRPFVSVSSAASSFILLLPQESGFDFQSWFNLFFMISAIGVVLIYYFHAKTLWLFIIGIVLFVLGSLGMSIFGYGQWKGRQNLNLLIDDYQQKVTIFTKKVESK